MLIDVIIRETLIKSGAQIVLCGDDGKYASKMRTEPSGAI